MTNEKAGLERELDARRSEVRALQAENAELSQILAGSHEERRKAESAYALLAAQQSPLHLQYHKVPADIVLMRTAHSKAVQLNGEMCEHIIDTLVADVRRHFGFLPRPLENKVDEVGVFVCVVGVWVHLSSLHVFLCSCVRVHRPCS